MIQILALMAALQQPALVGPARIAGPVPSALLSITPRQDSSPRAVVHNWQEPALIGGGIVGALGTFAGYVACDEGDGPRTQPCPAAAEEVFLFSAAMGGTIGGLLGSTSRPPPPGAVLHGNHGKEGALLLAVPSGVINALWVANACRPNFSGESCSGATLGALVNTGIDALIGYLVGRSEPRYDVPTAVP